eukprot:7562149-Pyramimonas_sp.AAC.1
MEAHNGHGEALGTELDGRCLRSGITSSRLWKLERGLSGLLSRRRCSGRALETSHRPLRLLRARSP